MNTEKSVIGIEFGSTRIKAVLVDERHAPVASGEYEWENRLVNGIWTYSMDEVVSGLRECYAGLKRDVLGKYGITLKKVGAIGISGMMHGYLPFDSGDRQLAEFRTWRNTVTGQAAKELTVLFGFNIPERWSVAHLYQAILNGEEHVSSIAKLFTLAGYIHYRLTGKFSAGIGEASGMFPVDSEKLCYNADMLGLFDEILQRKGFTFSLQDILPEIRVAGESAGYLTEAGALLLDPEGDLQPGIPFAPCEGDAGTGMAATNSVGLNTGNVSAGTSDFAMIVTNRALGVHREIDMVTTPDGKPVAMVHCNNCTSDINAWVGLFAKLFEEFGVKPDRGELYTRLFRLALDGDEDCGGLVSFNYYSGETITNLSAGRPMLLRTADSVLNPANFMRCQLFSALATLKIGLDILTRTEGVTVERIFGHGGFFKTPEVGQRVLSAAVGAPVSVMKTAGEGGPYGMALLCAYMLNREENEALDDYLENKVFADAEISTVEASKSERDDFDRYMKRYIADLPAEHSAVQALKQNDI